MTVLGKRWPQWRMQWRLAFPWCPLVPNAVLEMTQWGSRPLPRWMICNLVVGKSFRIFAILIIGNVEENGFNYIVFLMLLQANAVYTSEKVPAEMAASWRLQHTLTITDSFDLKLPFQDLQILCYGLMQVAFTYNVVFNTYLTSKMKSQTWKFVHKIPNKVKPSNNFPALTNHYTKPT